MPWHIEDDNPDCAGFAVVKDADGSIAGCHDTKDDADQQMAALYANEPEAASRDQRPPKDGIRSLPPGALTDAGDGRTLIGHLARPGQWAEISSAREGHFMETHAAGAFARTFAEDRPKILFQHGKDPQLGNRPIADPQELGEDAEGPFYRAEILDGLDPLIVDGLRRGLYGSSHTFEVVSDTWDPKPKGGPHNPKKLPERVIKEVRVWEMGPVTWPAYAGTTSARSEDPIPERKITLDQYVTREEKASRVTELKAALSRQAIEYPGVLPADAQATWDADTAELETLERDIAAWDSRQARLAAYAQDPGKTERTFEPVASFVRKTETDIYDLESIWTGSRNAEQRDQKLRDNAMRATETANFAHPDADVDKTRANIGLMLDNIDSRDKELARRILTTGSPVYRRAFYKYLLGQSMTTEEQRAAALTVQTDATGGYSVPFYFDPTLVATGAWTSINPYRNRCRVIPIVGTDTFHGVTAAAAVVTRAAEATAVTEGGPAIGQISAIVGKVHGVVTLSIELMQDNPGIAADMVRLIAEAKDTEEESIFTIGVGDALGAGYNPIGVLAAHGTSGAYTHVETAGNNVLAAADAYLVEAGLPVRHRMNAEWFMGRATIRAFQALETTGGQLFGGQYYNRVGYPNTNPVGNTGQTLLSYPINEVPSAPTGTTSDYIIAALIDPKSYYIIERVGMTVEVIPHLWANAALPLGQRAIYAWWRNTAKPANVDAGRQLAVNAP